MRNCRLVRCLELDFRVSANDIRNANQGRTVAALMTLVLQTFAQERGHVEIVAIDVIEAVAHRVE